MKILGVDPGEKNIGIAISDPTGTIARPLVIINHISKRANAERISEIAKKEKANLIIIGQATDIEGKPNFSGRKSARLAGELSSITDIPVKLWDESYSTQKALETRIKLGVPLKARQGHLDEIAASIILQTYLDARSTKPSQNENSA